MVQSLQACVQIQIQAVDSSENFGPCLVSELPDLANQLQILENSPRLAQVNQEGAHQTV